MLAYCCVTFSFTNRLSLSEKSSERTTLAPIITDYIKFIKSYRLIRYPKHQTPKKSSEKEQ